MGRYQCQFLLAHLVSPPSSSHMSFDRLPRCLNRQAKWDSIVNTCDSLVKWYNLLVRILSDPDSESPMDEISGDFDRRKCMEFLLEAVSQRHDMGKGTCQYKMFHALLQYDLEQLRNVVHVSRDGWVMASDDGSTCQCACGMRCEVEDQTMQEDDDDDDEFFSDVDEDIVEVVEEEEKEEEEAGGGVAQAYSLPADAATGAEWRSGDPFPIVSDPHLAASAVRHGHPLPGGRLNGQGHPQRDEKEEQEEVTMNTDQ